PQGAIPMIGRPLIAQDPSRLGIQTLSERKGETRLADAGLTGEQHNLTFASSGPLEALQQKSDFVFATDEWGELMPMKSFEATFGLAFADDAPDMNRRGEALQVLRAEISKLEQSAQQLLRRFGDDDRAGF